MGVKRFHWNRRGITRDVLLTRRWAIKFPTTKYGLAMWCRGVLANKSEAEWSSVEGVNPVRWQIWFVNVYRRAVMPPDDAKIDYRSICPSFVPIGDRKPDNVGYVDGHLVWIDYDYSWNGPRCPSCGRLNHVEERSGAVTGN